MFAQWLQDCRSRLAASRGTFWRSIGLVGMEGDLDPRDQIPADLYADYVELLASGTVIWSAIAQVNSALFEPGPDDLPANTIFSLEPYFEAAPNHLLDIAHAVFELKDTEPRIPELAQVAATISDEYNYVLNAALPARLTAGHAVYMTSTIVHRSRLPGRVLGSGVLPMVVSPGRTPQNMHLPLAHWPPEMAAAYPRFDELLDRLPARYPPPDLGY